MTSLPTNVPDRLQNNAHAVSAYNICLTLERSLQLAANNHDDVGNFDFIYIRILGYLIHYVPTEKGLHTVVLEVFSAKDDRAILDIGKMYYNHFIRGFQANRGRTSTPSSYASRPSFDTVADMISNTLTDAPQSHATAKENALIRDRHRCVITGKYDTGSVLEIKELKRRVEADPNLTIERTRCAHIFGESTNADVEPESGKRVYAATMWAIMERFGYTRLLEELNGSKIHRLENVMTTVPGFNSNFDLLMVWLVGTDVKNKYKLEAADSLLLRGYPEYVTFTTHDPVKFPVPSPVYLAIHAACAKVAHLSGAAACIDKFYQDLDDSTTLDPNGASGEMLEHAIAKLQIAGYPVTA